ncbi:MAG: hypothetical protein QOG04_1679 [Actinomycetota bacterium]|nr:hypothetical protein [Actinomycetota bacterium]
MIIPANAPAAPDPLGCTQVPELGRWQDAGTPDAGLADTRITVHRGAAQLAPENTVPAYEYAIAYDVDMIEIDVQQTLDHRYVVFHDWDIESRTGQPGKIPLMTYAEVKAINVVQKGSGLVGRWKGSAYDPSYMPDLEEILALASQHGVGINFDLKESVYDTADVALLAAQYPGVIEKSIFQPYVPARAEQILAAVPDAKIMLNPQFSTPPGALYVAGAEYDWFGSDLPWYPAEAIVAIHDACALVQPNVYSDNKATEAADLQAALDRGVDGAMVNNPDVAADVLDQPVPTSIVVDGSTACLLGHHDLGLPGKPLDIDGTALTTAKGGCVPLPTEWTSITFAGDGSALASSLSTQSEPI